MNKMKKNDINQYINEHIKLVGLPDFKNADRDNCSEYFWPARDNNCFIGLAGCCDTPDRIISHVLPKNRKVMVQAGGNAGYFVRKYADNFETVYSFEPDPFNFICLCLNTLTTNNVHKFQACVGDNHQLVSIKNFLDDDTGGIHITPTLEISNTSRKVPTFLIDDLNLERCDLIQLDVEGYEYYALKGATNTIQKYRPVLCLEYYENGNTHETWNDRYGDNRIEQIEDMLIEWGYRLVDKFETDRIYKIL